MKGREDALELAEALAQDAHDLLRLLENMSNAGINFHEGYERATEMLREMHKDTSPLGELRNAMTCWREDIEKHEADIIETQNSLRGEQ